MKDDLKKQDIFKNKDNLYYMSTYKLKTTSKLIWSKGKDNSKHRDNSMFALGLAQLSPASI